MLEDDVEEVGLCEVFDDLHDVGVVELLQDLHFLVGLKEVHILVDGEDLADSLDAAVTLQNLPDDGSAPPEHSREVIQFMCFSSLSIYYLLHPDLHILLRSHALQAVYAKLSVYI